MAFARQELVFVTVVVALGFLSEEIGKVLALVVVVDLWVVWLDISVAAA